MVNMKHPIYKVMASIVLVVIVVASLYFLFTIVSSPNKETQYINWHKAILYTTSTGGAIVGLLLLNTKMK